MKVIIKYNFAQSFDPIKIYRILCALLFLNFCSLYPNLPKNNGQKFKFFDVVLPLFSVAVSQTCRAYQEALPIYKYLIADYWSPGQQYNAPEVAEVAQETSAQELVLTRSQLVLLRNFVYPQVARLILVYDNNDNVPFDQNLVEIINQVFPAIEELDLSGNRLEDRELAILADSPLSFRIRVLDLTLNNITAQGITYLRSFTQLQELNLSTNLNFANSGLEALSQIRFLAEQLQALNLESANITPYGLNFLQNFTSLRNLTLASNTLRNTGIFILVRIGIADQLESLDLSDTGITAWGVRTLLSRNFARLVELCLNDNNDTLDSIREEWLSSLAQAPFANNLRMLTLSNTNLTRRDIEVLTRSFSSLRALNISYNRLTALDLIILAKASFAANLEILNVNNNRIQQEGNGVGVIALYFTSLRRLFVSHNELVDSDIVVLASAHFAQDLRVLDISHNTALSDNAFRYLAQTRAFSALISLDIAYTNVTRNALAFLAYCAFSTGLEELYIGNIFSPADLEHALTYFPALKTNKN